MDLRGPTRSTQRPNTAADEPRTTMAMEKIQPTSFRFQSPGADCGQADELGQRQVEGRKGIDLADAKVHGEGGRGHHKAVETRTGNGVFAIKK